MNTTVKFLVLGLFAAVLAACSSAGVKEDSSAVDNVTWTAAEAVSIDNENTSTAESVSQDLEAGLTSVFYFEFDKSSLTTETRSDLDAYAKALVASPRNIRLEGHADERGSREYNIALGERRAKSVADYLIALGVSADYYTGPDNGGHEAQNHWTNYQAVDTRGISIYGCNNVYLNNIDISNINSKNGHAKAIDILDNNTNIQFDDIKINGVAAGKLLFLIYFAPHF